jgi:glycerophosphoryl diester phosphodiesterase
MVVKVLFLVQNHVVKKIQDNNIKILVLHKVLATKRFIDKLHKLKIKVLIWTVDGKEQIIKYRNKGVDGIISNYPNKF